MLTILLLAATAMMAWLAHRRVLRDPESSALHARTCWSWACVGGFAGSVLGIVAIGRASLGALAGAVLAYLLTDYVLVTRQVRALADDPGPTGRDDLVLMPVALRMLAWLRAETNRWASKAVIVAGLAFAAWSWYANQQRLAEPPAQPAQGLAPLPAGGAPTPYDQELAGVERRYPQVNPESALYDARLAGALRARSAELQRQGEPPELALRRAVAQVLERPAAAPGTAVRSATGTPVGTGGRAAVDSRAESARAGRAPAGREAQPECEFKTVMTDADYRACGARPPTGR